MKALMRNTHLRSKEFWEIGRFISYVIAQVNSTKKITLQQVVKFPWEMTEEELANQEQRKPQVVTNEEREELIRKSKEMEKILFGDK